MALNTGITSPRPLASLARINTRYLIEWHRGGQLYKSIALPLPPKALTISQSAPSQITYTLGKRPIRELGRYRERSIELSGSAGYDARPSMTAEGAIISAFGPAILISFRQFLEEYQEAASLEGAEASPTSAELRSILSASANATLDLHQLIFRALDEDLHLFVEVDALTIQRTADGDNLAPAWTLQLKAYDDADSTQTSFDLASILNTVTVAIQLAANATAAAQLITGGANAYVRRGLAPLLSTLDQLTNAARGTVEAAKELADIPIDIIRQIQRAAGRVRALVTSVIDEVVSYDDEFSAEWQLLLTTLGLAEDIESAAESVAVSAPYSLLDALRTLDPPTFPHITQTQLGPARVSDAVTSYRLRLGEDLRVLANRLYRAPERWPELQRINGWLSERHNARGILAREGDLVLLPIVGDTETQPTRDQRSPYGQDLFIDPKTGDLQLKAQDLTTVKGSLNIEQAARHRLTTTQGETPILDGYGLPQRIGGRITADSAGYLSAHIREQLTRDPRLESVNVIEISDRGDHLSASLEFRAVAGAIFSERIVI